ncbi:A disintegrin and metalloproteinase with thrombospondin motifs 7, partial [Biomphalaria glabrata]
LSADHDGENNSCSDSDRYIMNANTFGKQTPETKYNLWRFSSCSVNSFTNFLTKTVRN